MANSSIESPVASPAPPLKWAPAWVIACVAAWPAPGIAEGVLVLGALVTVVRLLQLRARGDASALLSAQAWALTSVLFFAYWMPQLLSVLDAFRIALVHFNLFVLPAIIAALSARAPAAPAVAPQPSEVARTSKRNRHDRRRRR